MIIECAYCGKLYDEEDGIFRLGEIFGVTGMKPFYVFKCKNCMDEKTRKRFEEFKKRKSSKSPKPANPKQ